MSGSRTRSASLPLVPGEALQLCRRALPSVSSSVCTVTARIHEGKTATHPKSVVFKPTRSYFHLSQELNSPVPTLGGDSGTWLRWLYYEGQNRGQHSSCEYPAQIFGRWLFSALAFSWLQAQGVIYRLCCSAVVSVTGARLVPAEPRRVQGRRCVGRAAVQK